MSLAPITVNIGTKPPPTRLDPIVYDPNDMSMEPWASYCPARRPAQFKVHSKRQHATSAITQHRYGILYEWDSVSRRWVEVFNFPNQSLGPPRNCDGCGNNMWVVQPATSWRAATGYNLGKIKWVKKGHDDFTSPVFACSNCR